MKKIFIIIVNYNGEKDTKECLQSLSLIRVHDFNFSVVLVDNGSVDFNSEDLNYKGDMHVIKNDKNFGFVKANNQGVKYALENGADYICLLNNDTTVSPDFLTELIETFANDEQVGIISPKIYFSAGREYHERRYKTEDLGKVIWYAGGLFDWENIYGSHRGVDEVDAGQYDKMQITDFATGCCFLIKKEVVEKIGLLNEKYFAYLEDVDYCVRAKRAGYKVYYQPRAVIWHKNASSSGGPGSKLHFFLQERNRLIFGLNHAAPNVKLYLLLKLMRYLFSNNYKIALSAIKRLI
jgi:hypothetical protein